MSASDARSQAYLWSVVRGSRGRDGFVRATCWGNRAGWKREGERIHLHDCTGGLAVTAKLPDTAVE